MTINWDLPIETTETPPRPVRVLFDRDGVFSGAVFISHLVYVKYHEDAFRAVGDVVLAGNVTLRNVPAKPAPVLRECWVNL